MKKIPILEIFGPTVQGEGMVIGQKTMFVRVGGCDYRCAWCDSSFTWDGTQRALLLTAEEIWQKLKEKGKDTFCHVTISGGNPALYPQLAALVTLLKEKGMKTAVETQGSIWQEWMMMIDDVTISPKPPSANMETDWEKLDVYVERLTERKRGNISLKIVIFDEHDLHYAKKVHARYPHVPLYLQTGNDETTEENTEWLLSHLLRKYEWLVTQVMQCKELKNVKVLPQLHTLLWGNKQGV